MPTSASKAGAASSARPLKKRRPGRPTGSNGDETRRAVLEGALTAFAKHGYEGTSVRDLARELGVSHNLVHHHYGSKWGLWKAALEHGFAPSARELLTLIEEGSRSPDWEAAVRESVKGAVTLLARYPTVATIMADESARGGPRLDFLFDNYMKPLADLLANLLGNAEPHEAKDIDPRAAMLFLFSGITALFTHRGLAAKLEGPAPTSEKELARYAETVAELIARGLMEKTSPTTGAGRATKKRMSRPRAARA